MIGCTLGADEWKEQAIQVGGGQAEDGVSLVEVLVAISVLAVTMAATASSVIRSLEVARDSRESVIAANVVQYELERLRAIPFVDWVDAATSDPVASGTFDGPDGQTYEVTRRAQWIQAGAAGDGCASAEAGADGADYVRVSQTVVFPGRDIDPVSNVTIITPRLAFFDPYTGNLAITVSDRDDIGAAGHQVTIEGPAGFETATTDEQGCAFFAYLPVSATPGSPTTYDVTVQTPGHVDPSGAPVILDPVPVSIQTTTTRQYRYDEAATITPIPTVPPPAAGCTVAVVGQLGSTPGADPTTQPSGQSPPTFPLLGCPTGGPAGWAARVPLNLGHRLHHGDSTFASSGSRPFDPLDTVKLPQGIGSLFPFDTFYGVQAGRCIGSDPIVTGAVSRPSVATEPGQTAAVTVPMAVATVTAAEGPMARPDVEVFADTRDSSACPGGERLYLGRSGSSGTIRVALPFGDWVVHWEQVGDAPRSQRYACAEVPAAACTTLRADGVRDPVTGQVVTAVRQ